MTGRHGGPPLGNTARDTTAPPYHGTHRAPSPVCDRCGFPAIEVAGKWQHASVADGAFCGLVFGTGPQPDEPERCWSCAHPFDAGCECLCCRDDDPHGWWNPDA